MDHKQQHDYTNVELGTNIKVYVRARPPEGRKTMSPDIVEVADKDGLPRKLTLRGGETRRHGEHAFLFDQVFRPEATQQDVFTVVGKPLVDHALKGFNSCCFAYGQTGSGKTYSIFGDNNTLDAGGLGLKGTSSKARGIIPRSLEYLFRTLNDMRATVTSEISVQFLEMYCGQLRDLGAAYKAKRDRAAAAAEGGGAAGLSSVAAAKAAKAAADSTSAWFEGRSGAKDMLSRGGPRTSIAAVGGKPPPSAAPADGYERQDLELREDQHGQVNARGAVTLPVSSLAEVIKILRTGFSLRATHETKMNAVSSRSHTIFRVSVVVRSVKGKSATAAPGAASKSDSAAPDGAPAEDEPDTVRGTLTLVDLAGSERLAKSESAGQRLLEALSINASLSALGKVAMSLNRGLEYVPYRDSKLTRLLQGSLGGNSYTTLLATLHPLEAHYEECLSTLHFSNSCRDVVNAPRVNYEDERGAKDRRIRRLTQQVAELTKSMSKSKSAFGRRLATIMAQLGIDGEADEDGRFRLADGTVLGGMEDADELEGDADELLRSTGGALGGLDGLGGNNSLVGSTVKLRRHLERATVRNKRLKVKLADARAEALSTQARLSVTSEGVHAAGSAVRVVAARDRQAWQEERIQLIAQVESIREEHAVKLRSLARRTVTMLAAQKEQVLREQATLHRGAGSAAESRATSRANAASGASDAEWGARVESAEARAEQCKQQYTFWLEKSEKGAAANLERFSAFYSESRKRAAAAQTEIAMLYRHANALAAVWSAIESGGGFRPSGAASGIAALEPSSSAAVLAKQVALSAGLARRVAGGGGGADLSRHGRSMAATVVGGSAVGAVRSRRGPSGASQTAPVGRPRSKGDDHQQQLASPLTALDVGNSHMDKLIAEASPQLGEGQWGLRAQLEQQVLQELASHPTVEYIRRLEAEKQRCSARETDHAKEVSMLRMALRSKERTIEKLRKRPGGGRRTTSLRR